MEVDQVTNWSLSCVLRGHTAAGAVYFKAAATLPLFVNEPVIMAALARRYPEHIPAPLSLNPQRRWMLLPEPEQDVVIAGLLRRLWRVPTAPHPFRPLALMTAYWADETLADAARWPDVGLVQAGLRLFEELPRTAPIDVLLATDLHAGNVLRAQREPWLVIDPKPFDREWL